ncbi:MAG: pantoate--beta-alanine ligase [Legionellaceae bacterium]|nr:pantoate--beta-alanine ligase [Legionellaceae bacterium]
MRVIDNLAEWHAIRAGMPAQQHLGLVPTMGNLHLGHAELIRRSCADNDQTLVSIFVNPTQFNQASDLHHYPRSLEADIQLLSELGVDYCLLPQYEQLYADAYQYQVCETQLSQRLEGLFRPGHFQGVLTVVLKLLSLSRAHKAYFGEKDYQQYRLIHGMARAFFLETDIVACPTVREPDGLPYSSRNHRLSPLQRQRAAEFARIFHAAHHDCAALQQALHAADLTVEYVEDFEGRRYAAVRIDEVRLIDNYALSPV